MKRLELLGRRVLTRAVASVLAAPRRSVELAERPRILVVRLDERVGNLVLLTPMLESLRARYPDAVIDVLGYAKTRALLAGHPAVNDVLAFDKKALFAAHGPLGIFGLLRDRHYDVVLDAANPTDPSFTQSLIARFAGSRYSVGPAHGAFERLYTSPVSIAPEGHEIDLRLQLMRALPGSAMVRLPKLGALEPASASARAFVDGVGDYTVLNLGARIREKWLSPDTYAELARAVRDSGRTPVLTWGPVEKELAGAVQKLAADAVLAPPTNLADLAHVLRNAKAVVTCDTGPMHIAVAVGTPTCAIFVSTDPKRYGYAEAPHLAVDSRDADWRERVVAWLKGL